MAKAKICHRQVSPGPAAKCPQLSEPSRSSPWAPTYLASCSSRKQCAADTSQVSETSEAPQTWPWPVTWRLTCHGHSPMSEFCPPTIRDFLVKERIPQSGVRKERGHLNTLVFVQHLPFFPLGHLPQHKCPITYTRDG